MSNKFKIIPKGLTEKEKKERYDPINNNLRLKETGNFFVSINANSLNPSFSFIISFSSIEFITPSSSTT